jgi:molybdopterin molybdotransferase
MNDASFSAPPLPVAEAQRIILDHIGVVGAERLPITEALGRILQETIVAPADIPPHDNSAMDGYAVVADDVRAAAADRPVRLKVVGQIAAGRTPSARLVSGEAMRIMTGAPAPEGATGVVMIERTQADGDFVNVFAPVGAGENIRPRGEDVRAGDALLAPGDVLQAAEIGTLAAVQRSFVAVSRRPTVAILSTGDELSEIDEPLGPGKIVNSNAYSLATLAREAGAHPVMAPLVRDGEAPLEAAISQTLASADFLVSSGGVSVGDYDFVKPVLKKMGLDAKFWRVWMKPGKPLLFGLLRGKPYFGLPGNPVSSMVTFLLFVRPAIRKATGHAEGRWLAPHATARLEADVRTKGDRPTYLRARVAYRNGEFHARVMPAQGSGVLSSMLRAEGLVFFEEGRKTGAAGDQVPVIFMRSPFDL